GMQLLDQALIGLIGVNSEWASVQTPNGGRSYPVRSFGGLKTGIVERMGPDSTPKIVSEINPSVSVALPKKTYSGFQSLNEVLNTAGSHIIDGGARLITALASGTSSDQAGVVCVTDPTARMNGGQVTCFESNAGPLPPVIDLSQAPSAAL